MPAVASTFTIWTNRNTALGTKLGVSNDNHKRSSNADARILTPRFENSVYHSRLWTGLLGSLYDWLTTPAEPPPVFGVPLKSPVLHSGVIR